MPAGSDEDEEAEEEKPKKKAPAKKPASEKKEKAKAEPKSKPASKKVSLIFFCAVFHHLFKLQHALKLYLQADVEMADGGDVSPEEGGSKKRKVSDRFTLFCAYFCLPSFT